MSKVCLTSFCELTELFDIYTAFNPRALDSTYVCDTQSAEGNIVRPPECMKHASGGCHMVDSAQNSESGCYTMLYVGLDVSSRGAEQVWSMQMHYCVTMCHFYSYRLPLQTANQARWLDSTEKRWQTTVPLIDLVLKLLCNLKSFIGRQRPSGVQLAGCSSD